MLSVTIITCNEEENIGRTLRSVDSIADEVILLDSGSTDRTLEIARSFGPKVKIFSEEWKGFTLQKNSSLKKATGDWVLSLDADEEVTPKLVAEIRNAIGTDGGKSKAEPLFTKEGVVAASIPRRNMFLGRWIRHGGGYPDRKIRLFRRGTLWFGERRVHEDIKIPEAAPGEQAMRLYELKSPLIHHAYSSLTLFTEHMNRYSTLGAEILIEKGRTSFSVFGIVIAPVVRFLYNYFLRGGFLDGREGLLFHLYHSVYMSWKYAKAWEMSRKARVAPVDEAAPAPVANRPR